MLPCLVWLVSQVHDDVWYLIMSDLALKSVIKLQGRSSQPLRSLEVK